ncbi:hypothetical protein K438DRAFT_1884811 [Mycena galopus ATCC 62051]|nr:hypothetical protein K438DRAFT_1884811 [Mycena galopus ATCC 62051]
MFGFYMHVLYTRGMGKHRVLPVAIILLFILCTAHVAFLLASTVVLDQGLTSGRIAPPIVVTLLKVTNAIYITSNVLADGIFIFRCYAIWNFRWSVIVIPVMSTLCGGGFGYSDLLSSTSNLNFGELYVFSIMASLFTTFMLMGLSAGRIWWLACKSRQVPMGKKMTSRYRTVSAMILESGAGYCAVGIIYSIPLFSQPQTGYSTGFIDGAILGQVVGIAPTLIAVRVALGKSVEAVDSFVSPPSIRVGPKIQPAGLSSAPIEQWFLYLRPETEDDSAKAEMV